VQAVRRSVREYGEGLLTVRQLGEFLSRTARARDPIPGAQERLEVYPVVERCAALDAGLYRYDPRHHRLARLCGRTADVERLLADAGAAASLAEPRLQVLLVLAARRSASVPYALLLERVGALFQTMYLVATAMGLAPCALGHGDSDAFARAAGADYLATPSVGEFLLGSMR
jgi:SagB-type dehydrogenase family enzyme